MKVETTEIPKKFRDAVEHWCRHNFVDYPILEKYWDKYFPNDEPFCLCAKMDLATSDTQTVGDHKGEKKATRPDELTEDAAKHLLSLGARAVVVTLGAEGALGFADGTEFFVAAPPVAAIDATGAGDATMAALNFALLTGGFPETAEHWRRVLSFAVRAGSLACETRGGATAMPALARLLDA